MGYRLAPPRGRPFLRPGEIAARLLGAFEPVCIDREKGERFMDEFLRANLDDDARRFWEDHRSSTVFIGIGFDEGQATEVVAVPGHVLCVGFGSPAADEKYRPLVEQMAELLGYGVEPLDWKPAGAGLGEGEA
jgi:hypothetical protein